jgi:hypothetical protein
VLQGQELDLSFVTVYQFEMKPASEEQTKATEIWEWNEFKERDDVKDYLK